MLREQCRQGMQVRFGRDNGEKTIGTVIKTNPTKAKVQILESRGNGRGSVPGATWNVPYSLMEPVDGAALPAVPVAPKVEPLAFSPFDAVTNHLIAAINCIYGDLSPENLSCDGELSRAQVQAKYTRLQRALKGCFMALGREVGESEAYDYCQKYREFHNRVA